MPRGGLRRDSNYTTNHLFKPKWNNKKTTAIRIPEVFKDTLLSLARYFDKPENNGILQNSFNAIEIIENYSNLENKCRELDREIKELRDKNFAQQNLQIETQNKQKSNQNKYQVAVECFGEFVESQNLNMEELSKSKKGTKKHQLFQINQWLMEKSKGC